MSNLICFIILFVYSVLRKRKKSALLLHCLFAPLYRQCWRLEIGIVTLWNINLLFAWFLSPPQPINNVGHQKPVLKQ